jgi:hypothetical protein
MGVDETLQLTATKKERYFLIWITQLSPSGGPGNYTVQINDVQLTS